MIAWRKTSGFRSGDLWLAGHEGGLLAGGGQHNRPLLPARVKQYQNDMVAGRWRDCLSDPIAITKDGEVINGQHRIAAAAGLNYSDDDPAKLPKFLVIFGVDPAEIALADRSKRTANDMAVITGKLAKASMAAGG